MKERFDGAFIALGNFDGLHLGHKAVITAEKTEYERKLALMFKKHPQAEITGVCPGILITPDKEREILREWGVEPEYMDFSSVSDLAPAEFVDEILVGRFNARSLACGFNYRFGKDASGDAELLKRLCAEREIKLTVVDEVSYDGECISSTKIRKALTEGDMTTANNMLGRHFSYNFVVVHGDERGRILGSPTINQFFTRDFQVPQFGVYASYTIVDGVKYPSVTNVGIRPTIGNSEKRSETHILGFDGDLYGTNTEVFLIKKLRDEKQFSSLDELKEQIMSDRRSAMEILKGVNENGF